MNKITKELINDSSFDFFSSYLDINLRENRQIYQELVSTTKDIIKNSLERAKKNLEEGHYKGSQCAEEISNLYDHVIKNYYNYLNAHSYISQNKTDFEKMAIIATGGYGRGKISPGSDIDLLFLMPFKKTAWAESIAENLLYFLWDLGLKIGHATRNINECLTLSSKDQTITTSLLDARYICGDKEVKNVFDKKFRNTISRRSPGDFIATKLEERETRHIKEGQSRYLVEPNVKNGKGGLRDLESLSWMTNFCYEAPRPEQMLINGVLTKSEAEAFRRCEDFLWHIRCQLHFLEKNPNDVINFNVQMEMADKLGYHDRKGLKPVERFMKHYFLTAKEVGDLTRIICSVLEERQKDKFSFSSYIKKIFEIPAKLISSGGSLGLYVSGGRLNISNEEIFKKDPSKIILFFDFLEKKNLFAHPNAIRLIRKSVKLIDHKLRNNIRTNEVFTNILSSPEAEKTLRAMNESGVLGKFVPDFGKIVGLMQFNMYHHYTADEHLIKAVGELNKIFHSENKDYTILNSLSLDEKEKRILSLAIFFHDIAKGRENDHSEEGQKVVKKMAKRLGLSEKDEEMISWLVLDHLVMSDFAQRRDISDPVTISDFAEKIQNTKRLKLLLFLTVADIRAVGPGVWNDWKGELLKNLYNETYLALTGNYSEQDRLYKTNEIKERIKKEITEVSEEDKIRWFNLVDEKYWISVPEKIQIQNLITWHTGIGDKENNIIDFYNSDDYSSTIMTVITQDKKRLFERITSGCLEMNINIVDARIFSNNDNVIDILWIQDNFGKKIVDPKRLSRIKQKILFFINEKNIPMINYENSIDKRSSAFNISPDVSIDNSLSNKYSVIEVSGKDRPGLLNDLTRKISDLNINIRSAHIATFGERATDVFYVLSKNGDKITSKSKLKNIQNELIKSMSFDEYV